MNTHDTYLALAAAALDFGLSPAERTRLDAHLAGCQLCARSAAAMRADALVLAGLPRLTLPERRSAELLYAAMHPATVRHPLRLVAVAALLALLALGSLLVGAEILRRMDDDLAVVVPVPTRSPGPDTTPGPEASPIVPAEVLAWEELGTLDEAGVKGLVAFDGGYVAYGYSDSQGPVAWFSADGRAWEANPLGDLHLNCPGWGPDGDDYVYDADVDTGTTNGSQVLLAGTEQLFSDAACSGGGDGAIRMLAWVSSDGRTWQRSTGFAPGSGNARASGSWVIDGKWQVVDQMSGGVWESAEGLAWSDTGIVPGDRGLSDTAAASGSTVVGEVRAPFGEGAGTLSKWDGSGWSPLDAPACGENPYRILAPAAPGSGPWVVADDQSVCGSIELEEWQAWTLPTEYPAVVSALANTRYGVLLAAYCADTSCPEPSPVWQFLSQDGRTWAPIGGSVNALLLADGPAGVIALGNEGRVWRLVDTRPIDATPLEPTGRLVVTHDGWIEIVSLDGAASQRIAQGTDATWIREGQLAFTCIPAGQQTLAVCATDAESPGSVFTMLDEADRPSADPEGRRLAIHRGMIDVGETWMVVLDSDVVGRLSTGDFHAWSPDGEWLAGQPESAGFEVAIVGADGEGFRILEPGYDPAWSPAGDRIAYGLVEAQRASLRVLDLDADVAEVRYEAPAGSPPTDPVWLQDGALVFAMDGNLWRLDPGSAEPVALTAGLAIDENILGGGLDLSPDGRWLAFTTGTDAGARVGIASVDGTGWEMLELGGGPVSQPRWDPAYPAGPTSSPEPGQGNASGPPGGYWFEAAAPAVEADRPVGTITSVTAGGPGFVAVGRGCTGEGPIRCEAIVWTSEDGTAWQRLPVSDATNLDPSIPTSGPEIGMFDVAAGSPGVVAIGYAALPSIRAVTWFSPDGATWERSPLGAASSTRVNAVTWDGGQFVAVGEDRSGIVDGQSLGTAKARAAVWTSPDGRAWTAVPPTDALDVGGFIDTMEDPASGGMRDVVVGRGGLVAVGSVCQAEPRDCQPAAWTSADGMTWVRAGGMPDLSGILKAVAASGDGYVAVGAETCDSSPAAVPGGCLALVLTSPDGVAWTQQPFEQAGDLRTAAAVGERLFATAPDGPVVLWVSDDGSAWAPAEVEGGPVAPSGGAITEWHLASTPDVAVWLGPTRTEFDGASDPLAWVSDGNVP